MKTKNGYEVSIFKWIWLTPLPPSLFYYLFCPINNVIIDVFLLLTIGFLSLFIGVFILFFLFHKEWFHLIITLLILGVSIGFIAISDFGIID